MKHARLAALFLVSVAGIAYELYVMRIFSVGGWSNFGSLVISTALLGIGLSGIILTFFDEWVQLNADLLMMIAALGLPPLMALAVAAAQTVPFNPVFLAQDRRQIWFIGAYYLIYGVPFFGVATFTGAAFISLREEIQRVYFWNMAGSGVGGFFVILCMFLLPPQYLILPILAMAAAAALCACVDENGELPLPAALALLVSAVFSVACVFSLGDIRVSDFKAISYVRKYPDSRLVHHSYGPGGEYHVYASPYFHFAPGLSDNAALQIPVIPEQPYWGLFVDGSGPVGVMGNLRKDEQAYMDYLPMAAPYAIISRPDVLLVGLSGGINAQIARYRGAERIDIAEPSGEMIRLLRDDPNLSRFTGDLLRAGEISLIRGEGRSWCMDHAKTYDLIELSLVDSIGLSDSGGYPVHEDFKYTVEAFREYFGALKDGGILSVTVWDRLNPPRNVLRLLNSIIAAMGESGFPEPERSLYSFGLFMSTSTILVKNGFFTEGELSGLNDFVKSRSFETLYAPGADLPLRDINTLMGAYRNHFSGGGGPVESFTNADMYRSVIPHFFAGRGPEIEEGYIFDIRPIRDSRPYYSGFLKLRNLSMYLDQMEDISEEWGYLLLLGMLIQACLFGGVVIILPVIWWRRELFRSRSDAGSAAAVILYYAGLGLGYMLIEIYLIQRLGAFLSNPTYSTSIVITVMLISSALGNLVSGLLRRFRGVVVPVSCALIIACLLFHLFALDAFLAAFHSARLAARICAACLIIAPPAFFMGIPYPNGLDSLQENKPHLLPWAWGMNGGLSVAGSALARIISVSQGFPVLLMAGIGVYAAVGILFPVNTRRLSSW